MKPEDEKLLTIEQELENAHQNLHQTMSMVKAKMGQERERAEDAFSPRELLSNHLVGAVCVVGVFGYLVGFSKYRRVVGPAFIVAAGYTIWSWLANQGSDDVRVSL